MTIAEISFNILLALQSFLGVEPYPKEPSPDWEVIQEWKEVDHGHYETVLESAVLAGKCKKKPEQLVEFPVVYMAIHKVWVDGQLLFISSPEEKEAYRSTHGVPILSCKILMTANLIRWEVNTNSVLFRTIKSFPQIKKYSANNLFGEVFEIFGAGSMIILIFISVLLLKNSLDSIIFKYLIIQQVSFTIFFIAFCFGLFGFRETNLIAHKTIAISVWIGAWSFFLSSQLKYKINRNIFRVKEAVMVLSVSLALLSNDHDSIQLSIVFLMPFAAFFITSLFVQALQNLNRNRNFRNICEFFGTLVFCASTWCEIFLTLGIVNIVATLPIGILSAQAMFFFSYLVHYEQMRNEKNRIKEEFKQRETEEKYIKEKKELVDGVMHDLRSPIGLLKMLISNLEDGKGIDVSLVSKSISRISNISRRLDKSVVIHEATVQVEDVVKSIREVIGEKEFVTKDLKIILREKNKLENIFVETDINDIESIVSNILNNSIEASEQGCVVNISLESVQDGLLITFSDRGRIVSDNHLSRLGRSRFTAEKIGGSGIGMYNAAKLVRSWGGEISFKKNIPKGLVVEILLRIAN